MRNSIDIAQPASRPRLLFLNRCYLPDVEATGQLLGELCGDLALDFDVTVIAGQPNFVQAESMTGLLERSVENGVTVWRTRNIRFDKKSFLGRVVGLLSYTLLAAWAALWVRRPQVIIVETDPPVLGALGALLALWHRCPLVCYLQDLFPEVGIIMGKLKPGLLTAFLRAATQLGLRRAERIIVLGDDMKARVLARGIDAEKIRIVPNWVDVDAIQPLDEGEPSPLRDTWQLGDAFTVMYSGNLGLSQNLDQILEAARLLADRPIVFLFVGEGAAKQRLQAKSAEMGLRNVRFHPYQPKSMLRQSLAAAQLHLIPLQRGLAGCIVPSKLYGILAAGLPYVAAVDADSEVATITDQHQTGLRIEPDQPQALADAIRWATSNRTALAEMGRRGRALVESEFARPVAVGRFRDVVREVLARPAKTRPEPAWLRSVFDPDVGATWARPVDRPFADVAQDRHFRVTSKEVPVA